MSENTTTQSMTTEAAASPADAYSRIARLALEATSQSQYYAGALGVIGEAFDSPFAAIEVSLSAQSISESCHRGPIDPGFWKPVIGELITASLSEGGPVARSYVANDGKLRVALLASPIRSETGAPVGAVALAVPCSDRVGVAQHQAVLGSLTSLISSCARMIGTAAGRSASGGDAGLGQVLAKATEYASRQEMALAITNNLRNKTGCEQVALGVVRGGRVRVISISGFDEVKKRTPGVDKIRAAMDECYDHRSPIVYPPDGAGVGQEGPAGYSLHKQWRASVAGAAVASIPLCDGDRCIAILSMRRNANQPFAVEQLAKLGEMVNPYASALILVDRATRGLLPHAAGRMRKIARAIITPNRWARKVTLACAVLTMGWVIFGTMPYSVTTPCTVMPVSYRHFSAPHAGELVSAAAVAGDRVKAGDVLCEFDSSDLRMEKARLAAEVEIAGIDRHQGLAEGDTVRATLAAATMRKLKSLLAIVDLQIERSQVRAPFDGVVLEGDLRKSVGRMFTVGDPLYQLSSEQGWTLRLRVPESSAADLATDLTGTFISNARPGAKNPFRVVRVHPAAEAADGGNAYVVEAQLDADPEWVRAGMEGMAKVRIGRRPTWWVLGHRVIDAVRMSLWL